MKIRPLSIEGAWEITPQQHTDSRGAFLEWYRFDRLAEVVGHPLNLAQANLSISARGVVRPRFEGNRAFAAGFSRLPGTPSSGSIADASMSRTPSNHWTNSERRRGGEIRKIRRRLRSGTSHASC